MAPAACVIGLSACATTGAPARGNGPEASGAERDAAPEQYQLGPGDQIRVAVFGQPDLTGQFVLSAHGAIVFPLIGEVQAAGLTLGALTDEIATRLQQGYVRQPNVSVEVASYRPFFILGEVGEPGTYPFQPGLTVMRAVATAGGFTYRANSRRVFIQHSGDNFERAYDLTSMMSVLPGDTVRIPERRF